MKPMSPLSPEQRLDELARLLARGAQRWMQQRAAAAQVAAESTDTKEEANDDRDAL